MAETYRPTKGMQEAAKRALAWIKDGQAGQGFTDVGRKRASDIAAGRSLSSEIVLRMYSFFSRHEVDKKATGFSAGEDGYPTPGRVAWDAWGGDAGFSWSTKIRNQIENNVRALQIMTSEEGEIMVDSTTPDLKEELTELLADVFSFYLRAHGAHWNVVGENFAEYHALFAQIYDDVYSSVDPIAENLRKLGAPAPFKMGDFIALRTIQDSQMVSNDARVLATDLLSANDSVIESIADAFECATEYGQQGIANFLAERLDKHQMWKWQLSASLGIEAEPIDLTMPSAEEIQEEPTESGDQVDEMLADQGLAPMPIMPRAATGAADLPLAGRDTAWDASAADKRVQAYAGGKDNMDWTKYAKAFFYVDESNKELLGSYKLGFADVIDGELKAVPRGIFAVAAVLQGGRGGVDIPESDKNAIKNKVSAYYSKMAKEFDDATIEAPFGGRSKEIEMMEARKTAMETAERITMIADIRSVSTEDGSLKIGGYAATFNQEADGLNFREVIAPGAFTRTLKSDQPVFLLVNHDFESLPLASTQSGTLRLAEDSVGLRMEATLDPANPRAQELASALSRGDVDKMSFAFTVADGGDTREGGLRTLNDLDLYEVSVVTMPAYSSTSVGMRKMSDDDLALRKRQLQLKFNQLRLRK